MLDTLTLADFPVDPATAWTVHLPDDASVDLSVVATSGTADARPFAITFAGPLSPELGQATYPVEHERLGALHLFLVPIAREADGMRYEAVFG